MNPPEAPVLMRSDTSSTFTDNMRLPVHRWFRFSAGYSAEWVTSLLADRDPETVVLDPFAGSGTTLLAARASGFNSWGVEAHPFVRRIAGAKLLSDTDPHAFRERIDEILVRAARTKASVDHYPALIQKCFDESGLAALDKVRRAWEATRDDSAASDLAWLSLVSTLRKVSTAGTAPWQYVLPNKRKKAPPEGLAAFETVADMFFSDMIETTSDGDAVARLVASDARTCEGVPDDSIDAVITSPPYANNYDYADATRLEMSFMGDIDGWADLQDKVRKHLVRSCSQHCQTRQMDLEEILADEVLAPIHDEIAAVTRELGVVRLDKGGKKNYHLMVACYFADLARTWHALRRVSRPGADVCFVIGDSAPYGVYVPVVEWLGQLAVAAGFESFEFEKTRDRNIKWKNRKHRVPLVEGRLWVQG